MAHRLNYEIDPGLHTYHQCRCGRMQARSANGCALCVVEEMENWKLCVDSCAWNFETEDKAPETASNEGETRS